MPTLAVIRARFVARVEAVPAPPLVQHLGDCLIWKGQINSRWGYGYFSVGGRHNKVRVHRWAYEQVYGPIPKGRDLDHHCRIRACVSVLHLEPVTRRVNLMRGKTLIAANASRTHCPQGHPYDEENTAMDGGSRKCRICRRDRVREWHRRYAEKHGRWY